jgi:threonine/homoserine/homoserine lactone efflux protein
MEIELWFLILLTCLLGAISPGPSLLCVLQSAMNGGRTLGCITALAHAFGVLIWAVITLFGLDFILTAHVLFRDIIAFLGASYLIYLAIRVFYDRNNVREEMAATGTQTKMLALRDGLFISMLNPKLAIFFTALFSQFLMYSPSSSEKALMALLAAVVDGLWYLLVALLVTHKDFYGVMFRHERKINILSACVFIIVAMQVMVSLVN